MSCTTFYSKYKDRWICRYYGENRKRKQIGSFIKKTDAKEFIIKYELNNKDIMPPKQLKLTESKTLKKCLDFYTSLLNPESTKQNWRRSLISLVSNTENGDNDDTMLNKELGDKYKGTDVIPIITNFDKVVETVNGIKSKRNGQLISEYSTIKTFASGFPKMWSSDVTGFMLAVFGAVSVTGAVFVSAVGAGERV